jgi:hypothetical protein
MIFKYTIAMMYKYCYYVDWLNNLVDMLFLLKIFLNFIEVVIQYYNKLLRIKKTFKLNTPFLQVISNIQNRNYYGSCSRKYITIQRDLR